MLVTMASEKVQEPAVPRYPPEMLRFALSRPEIGLNVKVEPTPQEPIAGVILGVVMKLGNVLLNVMSLAPDVELVLVTVYSSVVVSPAVTVDGIRVILMIGAVLTTRRSVPI